MNIKLKTAIYPENIQYVNHLWIQRCVLLGKGHGGHLLAERKGGRLGQVKLYQQMSSTLLTNVKF